ncbi:MAG: zinc ribbon domain-containing protein [Lachnospiraceae bacterium]|nr:zinc ribbon domain-containing protein [Lachnospiraceae bacterium]
MRITCSYCGNFIEDTMENCPYCGGPNEHLRRSGDGIPKTIEELKAFCAEKRLPLDKMRFFIGEDHKGAKCFGICKDDTGKVTVYKNKSNGQRVVRYEGLDEAYACNEIYQKLRMEVAERKERSPAGPASNGNRPSGGRPSGKSGRGKPQKRKRGWIKILLIVGLIALALASFGSLIARTPSSGYYQYQDSFYYNDASRWYRYEAEEEPPWRECDVPQAIEDDYKPYWLGYKNDFVEFAKQDNGLNYSTIDENNEIWYVPLYEYENTDRYETYPNNSYTSNSDSSSGSSWSSSWDDDDWDDDDWDYDYSGWDSNDTDWDSDW